MIPTQLSHTQVLLLTESLAGSHCIPAPTLLMCRAAPVAAEEDAPPALCDAACAADLSNRERKTLPSGLQVNGLLHRAVWGADVLQQCMTALSWVRGVSDLLSAPFPNANCAPTHPPLAPQYIDIVDGRGPSPPVGYQVTGESC